MIEIKTKMNNKQNSSKWFNQLVLLLWKNARLQLRSPIGLLLGITVPALFAIILLPIRSIVSSDKVNDTYYKPFSIEDFPGSLTPKDYVFSQNLFKLDLPKNNWVWSFSYAPNNSAKIDSIMKSVALDLNLKLYCKY